LETIAPFLSLVSMKSPKMKSLSIHFTSIVLLVTAAPAVAESWVVESQPDWTAARRAAKNVEIADGFGRIKAWPKRYV